MTALGKLVSLMGMDRPEKAKGEHRGGVLEVPAIADIDEWERTAMAQQAQLVEADRGPPVVTEPVQPDPMDVTHRYRRR